MAQQICEPATWVLAAAEELNRNKSWTGRTHIHKLLFITKILRLAQPPFEFVVYDYGPYSFELDEEIINLEMVGHLDHSYRKPGYGPSYEPTLQGRTMAARLPGEPTKAISRVARKLGESKSQELELLATCLWVERKEKVSTDEAIVSRVRELKPKYGKLEIQRKLKAARKLADSLAE